MSSNSSEDKTSPPSVEVVRRPGPVLIGDTIRVGINAFEVIKLPTYFVLHYDVDIKGEGKPSQSSSRTKKDGLAPEIGRKIIQHMIQSGQIECHVGFDGRKNIYSPRALHNDGKEIAQGETVHFTVSVDLEDDEGRPARRAAQTFIVAITRVAEINLEQLSAFLSGSTDASDTASAAIMALNTMINHAPWAKYPSKKTSFFPPSAQGVNSGAGGGGDRGGRGDRGGGGGRGGFGSRGRGGGRGDGGRGTALTSVVGAEVLSKGLEMWRGYYTSLRPTLGKLIINVDVAHQPFVAAGDIIPIALAVIGEKDVSALRSDNLHGRRFIDLVRLFKDCQIRADFANNVSQRRKIRNIGKTAANRTYFEFEGRTTSVAEWWETTHNVRLRYPDLPCVQVSARAWYPLEVCTVKVGNKYNQSLTPDQTAQAIRFTTLRPMERESFLRRIDFLRPDVNPILNDAGIQFSTQNIEVKAKVLRPPTLMFAGSGHGGPDDVNKVRALEGEYRMKGTRFRLPAQLDYWMVVVFSDERSFNKADVQKSVGDLIQACKTAGMRIADQSPRIIYTGSPYNNDVENLFKGYGKAFHQEHGCVPQFLLCYLANSGTTTPEHAAIKRFGDMNFGVATQCLSIDKVKRKGNNQYYQNVALKVNVKLAGSNQTLDSESMQHFNEVPCMIMGADVSHPSPQSRDPSCAALVGTIDRYGVAYATAVSIQATRQEDIEDLDVMAEDLLNRFKARNGCYPKRVLLYRDGVSEGQFDLVLRKELTAVKSALQRCQEPNEPPATITYIVAGKRHHFRFMPKERGDKNGNAPPGTVVDSGIISPVYWDFWLQSHAGILGTSRSTHYTCLYDENDFSADSLTSLTYNLCYTYARSARAVSIVTPCYYAHLAATRSRELAEPIHDDNVSISAQSSYSRASEEAADRLERLERFKSGLKGIHENIKETLYFM